MGLYVYRLHRRKTGKPTLRQMIADQHKRILAIKAAQKEDAMTYVVITFS